MEKNKLFGTDGIRQKVGNFPLDDFSVVKIGKSLGFLLPKQGAKIVIGRDTRLSGKRLGQLIAMGISIVSPGSEIKSAGVISTPGLSYITDHDPYDYGIMITASHNPFTDNGIKIFGSNGEKIPESMETEIEEKFFKAEMPVYLKSSDYKGILEDDYVIAEAYRHFLSGHVSGLKIKTDVTGRPLKAVVDCANGATYTFAPKVFEDSGFDIQPVFVEPNGRNINRSCGSTHIDRLKKLVSKGKADIGIAFDGDGDRVMFMDPLGRILDGDHTLYMIAHYFLETQDEDDFNKIVVGTIMGNLGLEKSLDRLGIRYTRTQVGDKYVYREMEHLQAVLGGEQSGHTILRSFQKTGDGILTALYFFKALSHFNLTTSEVFDRLVLYPQVTKDIRVSERKDLDTWDSLKEMAAAFEKKYGNDSRLVIRYSGTEPKIRVMMESEHRSVIDENIGGFEKIIQTTIGIK